MLRARLLGLLFALARSSASANAVPITFAFTGTVTVGGGGGITTGMTVTGTYTFESTTPEDTPGVYGAVTGFTLEVAAAGLVATNTSASAFISVFDGAGVQSDRYLLQGGSNAGGLLRIDLTSTNDSFITSTSLPLTPPDVSVVDLNQLYSLCWQDFQASFQMYASIDSLTLAPEPGMAMLLSSAALAALMGRRRSA